MTKKLAFILASCATICAAQAHDVGGTDWTYNYSGTYSIANVNTSNEGILAGVLGSTLNLTAQLNLINGSLTATNHPVTITQSALNSFQANNLSTTAVAGTGLVSGIGNLVYNALNLSNGAYNGTLSGNSVNLSRASGATLNANALVDSRVLGTGVVLNLEAVVPTSSLNGTITGVDSGTSTPFGGGRVNTITGTAGIADTILLEAQAITYVAGIATVNTGYIPVGAINSTANSWKLSRQAQAAPSPGTFLTLLTGLCGFAFKRRKVAA